MTKWISVEKLKEVYTAVKEFCEGRYIKQTQRVVYNLREDYPSIKSIQQVCAQSDFAFLRKPGSVVMFQNVAGDYEWWQLDKLPGDDYENWSPQNGNYTGKQVLDAVQGLLTTSYVKKTELEEMTSAEIKQAAKEAFAD